MPNQSLTGRVLRNVPYIRRFYYTMARLDAERIAALGQLEASEARADHLARALHDVQAIKEGAEGAAKAAADSREHIEALSAINSALTRELAIATARLPDMKLVQSNVERLLTAYGFAAQRNLTVSQSSVPAASKVADLYLDLIEAQLTGTLRGDPSIDPWTTGYDPARRAIGRDWPATAETMIGTARMRNIRALLQRVLADQVPGDVIETGVWRGGACIYMRAILAAAGDANRRVFVADSFRGLPEPSNEFSADAGDQHATYEELAVSRDQVAENFKRYGLLDERVVFLEGWFKDTLPTAPIDKLSILRLDGDMYESTIQCLDALYHKVSPGGFVIVDDYILKPCAQAVDEFRARHGIQAPMLDVDGAAVWWQVPKAP